MCISWSTSSRKKVDRRLDLPFRHRRPSCGWHASCARTAQLAVLGITASPQEYDDYIKLVVERPAVGHTYKAYFGDIYQLDARLLPPFDYVALFHVGEFRTPKNDAMAR